MGKIILTIFILCVITGCSLERCEPFVEYATVNQVYYSPDSFGGYEHWTGVASKDNKEQFVFEMYEPVKVGDEIAIISGCGTINYVPIY